MQFARKKIDVSDCNSSIVSVSQILKYIDVFFPFYLHGLIISCGCRVVGAAPVADLHSAFSRQDALGAGTRLLLGKGNIQSVDKLTVIALMLTH